MPIEGRFLKLEVPVALLPPLPEKHDKLEVMEKRQLALEENLGEACSIIFSAGFALLQREELNEARTKVYCSEHLLLWLCNTVKKNELTAEEVGHINKVLVKELLPYFGRKYPQSEEAEVNLALKEMIIAKDNISNNDNDLVFRSGITFRRE